MLIGYRGEDQNGGETDHLRGLDHSDSSVLFTWETVGGLLNPDWHVPGVLGSHKHNGVGGLPLADLLPFDDRLRHGSHT